MIPSFSPDQTPNQAIFLMATLSPTVATSLEQELYRQQADSDASTEQFVLEDAFVNLLDDLGTIGVSVQTDYSDLPSQLPQLFHFLHLLSYLLPNTLYSRLKADPHLHSCLKAILTGSLGDHETVLQVYLTELGGLEPGHLALEPLLQEVADHYYPVLTQTETFTQYLGNLLDLLEDAHLHPHEDAERLTRFRQVASELIARTADVIQQFEHLPPYDALCRLQRYFSIDLLKPDNHIDYAYLLLESPATLPDSLIPSYLQKWYHYQVSHPWSLDYFKVRGTLADEVQQIACYAFLYARYERLEDYVVAAKSLQETYPHPAVDTVIAALYQKA